MAVIKDSCDPLSRISLGVLTAGIAVVLGSALAMGAHVREVSLATGVAFGVGLLVALISVVLFTIAVVRRVASWVDVGILAVVGGGFIGGSVLWLTPVRDDPVIFHPAVGTQLLGFTALFAALICAFRAVRH